MSLNRPSFLSAFCRFVTKLLEDLVFFVVDIPNNGQDVLEIMVNKPNRERQKLMREQNILKQVGCSSIPHTSPLVELKRHALRLKMNIFEYRIGMCSTTNQLKASENIVCICNPFDKMNQSNNYRCLIIHFVIIFHQTVTIYTDCNKISRWAE